MKTPIGLLLCLLMLVIPSRLLGEDIVPEENIVQLPVQTDPTISLRIWFKVGSQNDPEGKEGLANITASMLSEAATQNNTYEQILDKLFPLAAGYGGSCTVEMTVLHGRAHQDNLKHYYPLFMDAILRPAFRQEDLDRIRSEVLNHLENRLRYASDEELGKAVLYNDLFAGTPYGHIPAGTIQGVKSITIQDVKQFYGEYYTRENLIIGIGGSYSDEILSMLRTDLWTLPEGEPVPPPVPTSRPLAGMSVTIVEKDAPAAAISMGFPIDIVRGSREWYALAIANSWLGEHRNQSSHLFQVIREARGLNYGDYSYIEHYPGGGRRTKPPQNVCRRQQIFEIWIRPVPTETRHFALRAALREFKKLVENGMTQDDFQLTTSFLKKYVLHYAPTTTERLGYAMDDRFYGIDGSHLTLFRTMMDEITLEEVNAAIQKYWQYGNMHIAVITPNAGSFRSALVSDAASPITYATPKAEAVLSQDKEIQVFPVKVNPSDVNIVRVSDLFVR
jgi:zinc protease